VVLFLSLGVLWGLSFPAIAVGLEVLPPILFAAARYDVAAVLLLAVAAFGGRSVRPGECGDLLAILGGGVFLVAGNALLFLGQQTVPSGVAAIIQSLIPIITALWALLLLGERISAVGAAGVAVGFFGVGLVIQPDPSNLLTGDVLGRLLIVGQACSVALGGVLIQRASPTLDRVPLAGWAMALGSLLLHGLSLGLGERLARPVPVPTAVGAVLYLGVFSTAIAFYIYFVLLEEYGAFETALVSYLVPLVATTVGVVLLDEAIGPTTLAGFGLVAAGFAILKRRAIAQLLGNRPAPL